MEDEDSRVGECRECFSGRPHRVTGRRQSDNRLANGPLRSQSHWQNHEPLVDRPMTIRTPRSTKRFPLRYSDPCLTIARQFNRSDPSNFNYFLRVFIIPLRVLYVYYVYYVPVCRTGRKRKRRDVRKFRIEMKSKWHEKDEKNIILLLFLIEWRDFFPFSVSRDILRHPFRPSTCLTLSHTTLVHPLPPHPTLFPELASQRTRESSSSPTFA